MFRIDVHDDQITRRKVSIHELCGSLIEIWTINQSNKRFLNLKKRDKDVWNICKYT